MASNGFTARDRELTHRLIRLLGVLMSAFLIVLVLSYAVSTWQAWQEVRGGRIEVLVSGEGKVSGRPDIARVNAAIVVERESLADAQAEASRRSNALVAALAAAGIAERDVRTTGYNIFPQYSYPRPCYGTVCPVEDQPRIVGYQIRQSFSVTVREVARSGDVLSEIVASGVNEIGGLGFTIDDPDALLADARSNAIRDARTKIEVIARDLDKRVGRIVGFSESGGAPPIIFAREAADLVGKGGAAPALPTGENEITVTVSITYELR